MNRFDPRQYNFILVPLVAGSLALLVGAVIIWLLGANPVEAYIAMLEGAVGSPNAIADSLVKSGPILFVAIGICIAYRGGVINIGGEGQLVMGALGTTAVVLTFRELPSIILIPLALAVGFAAGGFWAAIAGFLKAQFKVNEVLSTVMLNAIAVLFMNYLLHGVLMDPTELDNAIHIPQTERFVLTADLPRLIPTRLHAGILLGVIVAFLVYILLWRTTIGYRIRAVGYNVIASEYAGINVGRYQILAIALSGALAGLGGAVEVLGVNHRLFTDGSATGFTGNAGFNGIVAALFGGLHPLGAIPASFLFGALLTGANSMQRTVQVPSAFVTMLDGLVVIFVVSSQIWAKRRATRRAIAEPLVQDPTATTIQSDITPS
ncbi:MAG: ABC transporter permease [Chloroflexota bacterium]|nr:MAG: ABC transporter permease [Chloroflexota bacterium]